MEDEDRIISAKTLAKLIGKSDRYVQQLVKDGILDDMNKDGKLIKLKESDAVQKWHAYDMEKNMPKADTLDDEKTLQDIRYKRTKADMLELELAELNGEMHRADDVRALTTDLILNIRSNLRALPGQCAMEVAQCTTPAECSEIIKKSVDAILDELADYNYDEEKYRQRVKERQGDKTNYDIGGDES